MCDKTKEIQTNINQYLSIIMDVWEKEAKSRDYEGYIDDTPFFALFIRLRKKVYETLLQVAFVNGYLAEEEITELANEENLLLVNGVFQFKPLSLFKAKKVKFFQLDMETLRNYIDGMEYALLSTPYKHIIVNLYNAFEGVIEGKNIEGLLKATEIEGAFRLNGDSDRIDILGELEWVEDNNRNMWAISPSQHANEEWEEYTIAEELTQAFLRSKRKAEDKEEKAEYNKNLFLELLVPQTYTNAYGEQKTTKGKVHYLKMYATFLGLVVHILKDFEVCLPVEEVENILQDVSDSLHSLMITNLVNSKTRRKDKIMTKEELRKTAGISLHRWTDCIGYYSKETFEENELKIIQNLLNLPII